MRLTVHTFVSLDGVMQGPGEPEEDPSGDFSRGGWLVPFAEEDWSRVVDVWFQRVDAFLLGRRTFEAMRGYWPQVTDPDDVVGVAYNGKPKYVASTTLDDPEWAGTTVLGDVVRQVRELKDHAGGELQVHGSWELVQSLQAAGLVDGYRVLQFPVVLGEGKRLFTHPGVATTLSVTSSEALSGGILSLEADVTAWGEVGSGEYAMPVDGRAVTA